ncbi:MAG: hypothetical protein ACFE8L_11015 [Candidatus Hodarchaeota archaeon]
MNVKRYLPYDESRIPFSEQQVPELKTEPVAITFHITAEFIMGILSLVSGIFLLIDLSWGPYIFFLAMGSIIYAVINAAGYYGQ